MIPRNLEAALRIRFDRATLHQGKSGSISAVVFFEFSPDKQFPGAGWNDFVVVIANWWRVALEQVGESKTKVDLRFMDGPYWITAVSQGTNVLLQCIEDRRDAGLIYEIVTETDDLKRELLAFALDVSVACKAAGIESADLDELRRHLPN
jgi:hypothetical protein